MAGAGFKTFNTGDVLTASDVNTYLMQQTVMVFASAAARTTALGANVAEGMISYLKDTNAVEVYDGSNWVSSDDPNAIQNTIVDAKGDLISATAADTPTRLASSGVNGDVLTVDTSTATGLKWATPTSGGYTLLSTTSLSGSSTTVSSISGSYTHLYILIDQAYGTANDWEMWIRFNSDTGQNYNWAAVRQTNSTLSAEGSVIGNYMQLGYSTSATTNNYKFFSQIMIPRYATSTAKYAAADSQSYAGGVNRYGYHTTCNYGTTSAISSITIGVGSGTFSGGTIYIYGVK